MSAAPGLVTESELHAYLDGELAPARIEAVEAHFLADDADALRFGTYRRQADLMRRLYSQLNRQPLSNDMLPLIQTVDRTTPRRARLRSFLVPLAVLALGGVAGWFGQAYYGQMVMGGSAPLNEALAAHRISIQDRPTGIEVLGGDGRSTLAWLAQEFGFQADGPEPDAAEFTLVGGQLVPSGVGIAAQLLLHGGPGERLTLYVQPGGAEEFTAFQSVATPGERMVTWEANGAILVLVGGLADDRLRTLAAAVQAALIDSREESDTPT